MIANLLNTALGLTLVYGAVLAPAPLYERAWLLIATGIVIVALAGTARTGDRVKWFNLTNAMLGAALVLLGIARTVMPVHPLVMFWWVFWVGNIVAVLAFWSALYTRADASLHA